MANLISSSPRQAIIFYPFKNRFDNVTEDNIMETIRIDATSSATNINYSKSKSNASGTFSMQLVADRNWIQILRPGDWGMLYISQFDIDTNSTKGLQALINIDRISKQKITSNDGKKRFIYRVTGRDFGKIFEKTRFYYNPYVPEEVQINYLILKSGIKITGSPETFVRSYLELYFGKGFIIEGTPPLREADKITKQLEKLDQIRLPDAIYQVFNQKKVSGKLSDILKIEIGGILKHPNSKENLLRPEGTYGL